MAALFIPARLSTRPNVYTRQLGKKHPRQIDPYNFPAGALAGLGDTGIPAVDALVAQATQRADRLVLATEIGTVCAVIGAFTGLMLLFGGGRR